METFVKNVVWLVASLFALALMGWGTVEYVDSKVGEGAGMFAVALLIGVFITMTIVFFTIASTNRTHEAAGEDIAHSIQYVARPLSESYRVNREYARGEVAALTGRTKLEVLDAKRIDQLAQQRAALLMDLERQKFEQQRQIPQWAVEDEGEDADYQEWR